jgi:hypothetical protein
MEEALTELPAVVTWQGEIWPFGAGGRAAGALQGAAIVDHDARPPIGDILLDRAPRHHEDDDTRIRAIGIGPPYAKRGCDDIGVSGSQDDRSWLVRSEGCFSIRDVGIHARAGTHVEHPTCGCRADSMKVKSGHCDGSQLCLHAKGGQKEKRETKR